MQRATIVLDDEFVVELDRVIAVRGYQNRSEAIRDLARSGMRQAAEEAGGTGDCIAALVYVYDHNARELAKRLTHSFHEHHDLSLSAMHVHLDHGSCLEVAILKGDAREVRHLADHVIAERGVRHGRLVMIPVEVEAEKHAHDGEMKRVDSPNISASGLRGRLFAIFAILIGLNIAAWIWAFAAFADYPVLLGTALLAYSFGLRHAVDADHIAAIDNVTRKLMQEGRRPLGVGLYFSLGHSTIVVLASLLIALGAGALSDRFEAFKDVGGVIGTSVSALFLFAVGIANIFILVAVYKSFKRVKRGGPLIEEDLDLLLSHRGLLGRVFQPLFRFIHASWQMYPLGFLFGLGF